MVDVIVSPMDKMMVTRALARTCKGVNRERSNSPAEPIRERCIREKGNVYAMAYIILWRWQQWLAVPETLCIMDRFHEQDRKTY